MRVIKSDIQKKELVNELDKAIHDIDNNSRLIKVKMIYKRETLALLDIIADNTNRRDNDYARFSHLIMNLKKQTKEL